jgi:tripartite-type tricarboxylate transporter receptor subunit TctC
MNVTSLAVRFLAACSVAVVAAGAAHAQQPWPSKPVRVVVAFPPGGIVDTVARQLQPRLQAALGQPVIIDNRGGAGGTVGSAEVAKAAPDGHTLLFMGPNNAIATSLYKRLPFDFVRGTEAVGGIMRLTNLMVVPPSLPVKTVQQFVDYAKKNPGKLSMASTGVGTSVHLSGELFKVMTKTDMVHVPYRGSAPAFPDLLTGKVHVLFSNLTSAIELVQAGQLRGLGVTSAKRWASLPDMPAIAETVPGYEADVWYGVVAPKGTSPEIVARLNKAINAGLADPELRARFEQAGGVPMPMSPAEFGKMIADETEKWRKVVEFAGVKVD